MLASRPPEVPNSCPWLCRNASRTLSRSPSPDGDPNPPLHLPASQPRGRRRPDRLRGELPVPGPPPAAASGRSGVERGGLCSVPGRPRVPARRGLKSTRTILSRTARRSRLWPVRSDRVAASRPVSRVLCRDLRRGDDHPSLAAGYPTAQAADPRTGQRDLFRPNDRFPERSNRVLLFGLAPSRVCRVSPTGLGLPRARLRLCGTGPRLAADGRYPLPCAEELGLSSHARPKPEARDRPADSPGGILVHAGEVEPNRSRSTWRQPWTLEERIAARSRGILIPAGRPGRRPRHRRGRGRGLAGRLPGHSPRRIPGLVARGCARGGLARDAPPGRGRRHSGVGRRAPGQVVGFVSSGPPRDEDVPLPAAEIYAIYVRPQSWRHGLGTEPSGRGWGALEGKWKPDPRPLGLRGQRAGSILLRGDGLATRRRPSGAGHRRHGRFRGSISSQTRGLARATGPLTASGSPPPAARHGQSRPPALRCVAKPLRRK
jgi:hypothetical protein